MAWGQLIYTLFQLPLILPTNPGDVNEPRCFLMDNKLKQKQSVSTLKRGYWIPLEGKLVEAAGIEPASANPPPLALHV
jgi:hypothetical protein